MNLVEVIVEQLGVSGEQASGGAGLLLNLAKKKLGDGDFGKLAEATPDLNDLLSAAPEMGGAASLVGGLLSKVGGDKAEDLVSLASGFSKLGLSSDMVGKFVPVIVAFVKEKGGTEVVALLENVLKK